MAQVTATNCRTGLVAPGVALGVEVSRRIIIERPVPEAGWSPDDRL